MAVRFVEGTNQRVELANVDLGSGDFAIMFWARVPNVLDGAESKYVFSKGGLTAGESLNMWFDEDTKVLTWNIEGRSGVGGDGDGRLNTTTEPGDVTVWQHYIFQRRSDVYEIRVDGSDDLGTYTETPTDFAAFDISYTVYLGVRTGLTSSRDFDGDLAEFAIYDGRSFDTSEAGEFAAGRRPSENRRGLITYVPLVSRYQEFVTQLTVTNQSSTIVSHVPKLKFPYPYNLGFFEAPAGGLSIPVAMHEYRQRHQSIV